MRRAWVINMPRVPVCHGRMVEFGGVKMVNATAVATPCSSKTGRVTRERNFHSSKTGIAPPVNNC
jgi:hypothetical protein